MSRIVPTSLTLGLAFLISAAAEAQPRVRIGDEPACARCRISLTRVAVLGRAGDPVALGEGASIVRDGRGRFFAGPNDAKGEINVYDPSGRFVRVLGRPGGGPGEFSRVNLLVAAPGDSLHVFDLGNLRQTVFTPDFRVARTVHVPGTVNDALPQSNGELVAQFHVPSRELAGFTVHRLDAAGRFLRSFAEIPGGYRARNYVSLLRPLAPAAGGGIWAAHASRYEIDLYGPDGRRRKTLVRDAPWFEAWSSAQNRDPRRQRPRPGIVDIRQDRAGRLWVVLRVADPRWRARPPHRGPGEEGLLRIAEATRMFDTLIEVIDPATGRLLVRARNPEIPFQFAADDVVSRWMQREDGTLTAEILSIRLRQP